ncbi:CPBP family intramembrane glutamic endopeptidase [Mangrovibacterium lignilyticum]|uniref:CPBP family intramembrane glutamic endopeptidase n=1 Tax=Mangrovibacterium lignilyticum TaxID=2668052 RepID=UPI0013D58F09|nr:CPBP family intramembrane glutamic endopeptidase [Mangrovibacterium lignilyticum]
MSFTAFRGMGSVSQFFMALFVVLVCVLATLVVSILIGIPIFGFDSLIGTLSAADLNNPEHILVLKYLQTTQSVGMFVLPPFVIGWLYAADYKVYLSMKGPVKGYLLLLALLALVVVTPFVSVVGFLNQEMSLPDWLGGVESWMRAMENQAEVTIQKFIEVQGSGGLLFNLFMIAVIPSLGEEFLFRGVIQQIFTKMTRNYHWGIWISAFLFSALHMQFFGFVPRMLLGALFGYFLVYSGSIWIPVTAHFLNNALGVFALYSGSNGDSELEKVIDPDFTAGIAYYWPLAIVSLIVTVSLVLLMKKHRVATVAGLDEPDELVA